MATTYMTRGGPKTEDQLRAELQAAGYPGPWDINSMLAAYERAGAPNYAPKNASDLDLEWILRDPVAAARRALRDAGIQLGLGPFADFVLGKAQQALYNTVLSTAFGGDSSPTNILGGTAQFIKNLLSMPAQQGFAYQRDLLHSIRPYLQQMSDILSRTTDQLPPGIPESVASLAVSLLQHPNLQADYLAATIPYVGPYTGSLVQYVQHLYDLYQSENPEMNPNFLRYYFNRASF